MIPGCLQGYRLLVALPLFFASGLLASIPDRRPESQSFVGADDTGSSVSYIYVDGNEDGAGGGHVALRAGGSVFHFQRVPEGYFIVERSPWDGFLFSYSRLQNRNIRETVLRLTENERLRLLERLTELHIRHRWMLKRRQAHRDRIARLSSLLESGSVKVGYPVLGYFQPGSIDRKLPDGLTLQSHERPSALPGDAADVENRLEQALHSFITEGYGFRDSAFVTTDLPIPPASLLPLEQVLHKRLQAAVAASARLRPDRARTALEMLVLIESLERSREQGVWVIPQMAFTTDQVEEGQGPAASPSELRIFAGMFDRRQARLERVLQGPDESARLIAFTRMLQAASILDAAKRHGAMNVLSQGVVMNTPDLMRIEERRFEDRETVEAELQKEERSLADLEALLKREMSYALFTKNCVTELVEELQAVTGASLPVGHPFWSGLFIPFVSERYVDDVLGSGTSYMYRSFRNDLLLAEGSPVAEASTVTSSHYAYNDRDSFFIFFSEDRPVLRPVFGIVNLFAGTIQTAGGLPYAVFDDGKTLTRGVRGMAFSVTEMAFISVRKGTFRGGHRLFYSFPSRVLAKKKKVRSDE